MHRCQRGPAGTDHNDADVVLVADIYAAGEVPIEGVSRDALVAGLIGHGHRNVRPLPAPNELAPIIREMARPGDMVVRSYVRLNLFLRLPKQNIRELDRGPSPWFCGYRTRMRELNPHLPVRTASV